MQREGSGYVAQAGAAAVRLWDGHQHSSAHPHDTVLVLQVACCLVLCSSTLVQSS